MSYQTLIRLTMTVHPVHNIFKPGKCRVDTSLKPLGKYGMSLLKGGGGGVVIHVTYLYK